MSECSPVRYFKRYFLAGKTESFDGCEGGLVVTDVVWKNFENVFVIREGG